MNITICGYGFVGSSMGHLCKKNNIKFNIYDVQKKEDCSENLFTDLTELVSFNETSNGPHFYFICVPTPSKQSGECNTDIVTSLVKDLNNLCNKESYFIIKSTVQPGTCRRLNLNNVVFVPEFLTEANAQSDLYNAKFNLIGTFDGLQNDNLYNLFKELYKHNKDIQLKTDKYETYEIFKYTVNCFLATKVWFFNEIYEICCNFGVDYDNFRQLLEYDNRIGLSHTKVPGPDSQFGFGGSCFTKEMKALCHLQESLNIPNDVLISILTRNKQQRH
jgi:UDPglucose 6-dehydrogenase